MFANRYFGRCYFNLTQFIQTLTPPKQFPFSQSLPHPDILVSHAYQSQYSLQKPDRELQYGAKTTLWFVTFRQ